MLALRAVQENVIAADEQIKALIASPFAEIDQDKKLEKACLVLNKLHLLALKINFELFLNRLLTTVYEFHFTELATKIDGQVNLKELVQSLPALGGHDDVRDFIIEKKLGNLGPEGFSKILKESTGIQLCKVLKKEDCHIGHRFVLLLKRGTWWNIETAKLTQGFVRVWIDSGAILAGASA
jgi:hypothetical protein